MAKKTYEQYWLEQQEARRVAARAENRPFDLGMEPTVRQAIEKKIDRPLTDAEIIRRRLDRTDTRSDREKLATGNRQVVMEAKGDAVPYAAELKEAEAQVERERRAMLSPAERRAELIRDLSKKKIAEAASKVDHESRMQDPTVAAALATLKDLQNRAAFDPNYSFADIADLEFAERQLTTPGACLKTGFALVDAAVGTFNGKQKAIVDKILAQRADLESQLAQLGEVEYASVGNVNRPALTLDEAKAAESAAWKSYQDAKAAGAASDQLERLSAAFADATFARVGLAQSAPAAAPAGEAS